MRASRDERSALGDGMRGLIDRQFGGRVTREFQTVLFTAQRLEVPDQGWPPLPGLVSGSPARHSSQSAAGHDGISIRPSA